MGKTFANLRDALSGALGFDEYADLTTRDQADVDTIINAAYLECYAPKDGRRASWAIKYWSDIVVGPESATLDLTNGSNAVTGYTFAEKYIGSFVLVGGWYYRIGSTTTLVQPWSGTTGSHQATVYANAVALPGANLTIREVPSLVGIGPLAPMPYPESEVMLRSTPTFDFHPKAARGPFAYSRPRFDPSLITDVGDPRYYHVDSAGTNSTFATGARLHLYPIPGQTYTVEARFNLLPTPLAAAADEPVLPHDDVDVAGAILEPLMYEIMLKRPIGRRYAGRNQEAIFRGAADARALLNTLRGVQPSGPKQFRVASGW